MRYVAREMMKPYSAVRDWLVRMACRGLDGRNDRKSTGRKRILGRDVLAQIRGWVGRDP